MASKDDSNRVASTRPDNRRGMTKSQIRAERRQRSQSRKKRRRTFYLAGGGVLAVVFILSLTLAPALGTGFGGSRSNSSGGGGTLNEGGPVPLDPDNGNAHVGVGVAGTGYSTRPATSGPHWIGSDTPAGVPAPARWGIYDKPLPDEVLLHNLEHGGIGIHYDCPEGCDELIGQLEDLIPRNRAQFIMSPYSGMESKIAITAWRHHLFLDEFDAEQILDFIDAYQDRGPESVPGNTF